MHFFVFLKRRLYRSVLGGLTALALLSYQKAATAAGPEPAKVSVAASGELSIYTAWDEREQLFKMSEKIVRTTNVTQTAIGDKRGLWTTVIASAILIFE